jgi:hypothetical protein
MERMDASSWNRSAALARPSEAEFSRPDSSGFWPRALLPKNLSSYQDLSSLLEVFEQILPANAAGGVPPSDAVAALNHLKRLQRQAIGDPRLSSRLDIVVRSFAATAARGLGQMSAKNVALAMNSLAMREGHGEFLAAGARRVRDLCRTGHEFHTQVRYTVA